MSSLPVGSRLPLERYRRLMDDSPIVTVDVLFINRAKEKILLGKRENAPYAGEFYSFGSRMLKNEEFIDAAIRVAKEELGVSLHSSDLTLIGTINEINDTSIFDSINYHAVDIYFYCVIDETSVVLDTQHSESKWFSLDDTTLHPNVQRRIQGLKTVLK